MNSLPVAASPSCRDTNLSVHRMHLKRTKVALIAATACVVAAVLFIVWARPMFELPAPTGEFAIGTTQFHWVDSSRPEPHTANPLDRRELMVRVWYPASVPERPTYVSYWPDAATVRRSINESRWPFGWAVAHLDEVPTHSVSDAPVSDRQPSYPVLIFSHGLSMARSTQNTVLMEELASHGYIVFSIDHPYGGLATVYPDGRIARFSDDAWNVNYQAMPDDLRQHFEEIRNDADTDAIRRALERIAQVQPTEMALRRVWYDVWSKDQRFVIDEIEKLQQDKPGSLLSGRLQLDRLGVFGMSFGGVAAGLTCANDSRCKAGINLDGFGEPAMQFKPHRQPFMYFNNGGLRVNSVLMERDLGYRYFAQVAGTQHLDFTDAPLWSPLLKLKVSGESASGPIDELRMLAILNAYVTAFFDTHLRQRPSALLQEASGDFPEVTLIASGPRSEPPDMSTAGAVASGFAAKLACSGIFVSGRPLQDVVENDIDRMSPLVAGARYDVSKSERIVTATHLGSTAEALYRPGVGCTLLSDTDRKTLLAQTSGVVPIEQTARTGLWPEGDRVDASSDSDHEALALAVEHAFEDTPAREIDTRAMVVVHGGRIVAERYAAGYSPASRMLGWSASKSVLATIVGTMVADGKLSLQQPAAVPEWQQADDARRMVTIDQLMRMSSGLSWREDYVPGSDSTEMLFQRGDMGRFAAGKQLAHDPGVLCEYSSGTTNLLSRIVLQTLGSPAAYQQYVRQRLLEPAGMLSFVLEPDATGAFVGSSYAYATARDWARFGLLYLNRGMLNGRRILTEDWVDYVRQPAPATRSYGGAHFAVNLRNSDGGLLYPSLPEDTYMAHGNRTQVIAIVPSRNAVIVRLGWTADSAEFDIDRHFGPVLKALPRQP